MKPITKTAVAVAVILSSIAIGIAIANIVHARRQISERRVVSPVPAPQHNGTPAPSVIYAPFVKESFSLNTGDSRYWQIGNAVPGARFVKIELRSTGPVDIGIMPVAWLGNAQLVAAVGQRGVCHTVKIREIDTTCTIPSLNDSQAVFPIAFVVRDSRGGGTAMMGAAGALLHNQTAVNNAVARNDVTLTLDEVVHVQ